MTYNIRAERSRLGMTQTQLAKRLNVDPSSVVRWENGGTITQDTLINMRDIFGCTIDWLLGLTDERRPVKRKE